MKAKLQEIHNKALEEIANSKVLDELQLVRNNYLSKKSELMSYMSHMKNLQGEERIAFGQLINSIKEDISLKIEEKRKVFEELKIKEKLESEIIDFTLPSKDYSRGSKHPFNAIVDEVSRIFIGMGYQISEGPEVETDEFNFEL